MIPEIHLKLSSFKEHNVRMIKESGLKEERDDRREL